MLQFGTCHVCRGTHIIKFCPWCAHWFCARCWRRIFARGSHAMKELITGKTPGCCGPSRPGPPEAPAESSAGPGA